jgi:hypothetical protein
MHAALKTNRQQSVKMADYEGDSQMTSPSDSEDPSTPNTANLATSHPASSASAVLSPPDSQHRNTAMANANGKRPLNTISNGPDDEEDIQTLFSQTNQAPTKHRADFPPKTHAGSGYTWNRAEDEPGYAWLNKKAMDEFHRAWDGMVHRESMVKGEYLLFATDRASRNLTIT